MLYFHYYYSWGYKKLEDQNNILFISPHFRAVFFTLPKVVTLYVVVILNQKIIFLATP